MEPNNDIIKDCLNKIDNTEQQLLEHFRKSLDNTKSLLWTHGGKIIQILKVQMYQRNHKAIYNKQKDESTHEYNAYSGDNWICWKIFGYITCERNRIYYEGI